MFYQFEHIGSPEHLVIEKNYDYSFPLHIHQCFEVITINEGYMKVTVENDTYTLKKNEAILIFPNQLHSLDSTKSRHTLCIFSPQLVKAYSAKTKKKVPKNNKFIMDERLISLFENLESNDSEIFRKGVLYLILDNFDRKAVYKEQEKDNKNLIYKMFSFVEKNFDSECTLTALSKEIGYNYSYLSRYFKDIVGISFNEYVNNYRLNHACYLLHNSTAPIIQCTLESGFVSLRSFNRNFKQRFGLTPTEYRNKMHKDNK